MNNDKITYYYEICEAAGNLTEALSSLAGFKNQLSAIEYETVKAQLNTKYQKQLIADDSDEPQTWDWFEEEDLPPFNWVCHTLGLSPGPISILSAFSNTGKTFFAANLAICIANNIPIFGSIPIDGAGDVLHIDWDQGQKFSKIYYWKLMRGYGLKNFKRIQYVKPEWHLHDAIAEQKLLKWLPKYKLCIIDCLGSAIPAADLNDDRVRAHIDLLNTISEKAGCAILMIHHEPKTPGKDPLKSVKGNGSIISAAGGSIHLTKEIGSQEIKCQLGKKRLVQDFSLSYTIDDCGDYSPTLRGLNGMRLNVCKSQEEMKKSKEANLPTQILELLSMSPGINTDAIKHQISARAATVVATLASLIKDDLVRTEGEKPKRHFITDEGTNLLHYTTPKK